MKNQVDEVANDSDFVAIEWVEYTYWVAYLAGIFWVPGYLVLLPLGWLAQFYLTVMAIMTLFFNSPDYTFGDWLGKEFLRAFLGYIYFVLAAFLTLIPVVDWVSSPLLAWAAVANLYYYDYELFGE